MQLSLFLYLVLLKIVQFSGRVSSCLTVKIASLTISLTVQYLSLDFCFNRATKSTSNLTSIVYFSLDL
jgi:hypothetical protein